MCVLPFYYVYGLSLLHTHLAVGGSLVIDNSFAFPNVVLRRCRSTQVTGFAGVPSTFALLLHRSNLERQCNASRLCATSPQAGGGMSPPHIREWLRTRAARPVLRDVRRDRGARAADLPAAGRSARQARIDRPADSERRDRRVEGRRSERGARRSRRAGGARRQHLAAATGTTRRRPRRSSDRAAIAPAISATPTTTVTCFWSAAATTCIKVGAHRVGAKEIEDVI